MDKETGSKAREMFESVNRRLIVISDKMEALRLGLESQRVVLEKFNSSGAGDKDVKKA